MTALAMIIAGLGMGFISIAWMVSTSLKYVRDSERNDSPEKDGRIVSAEQLEAEAIKLVAKGWASDAERALKQAAELRAQAKKDRQ